MQSLRETSWSAASPAAVESMGTPPSVAPSLPSVAMTEMADSFLTAAFFRRITEYNISWCSAAVRIPLLWVSLPRYQGAAGETGAAPCQEQITPVSSNQPIAGHSWVPQPPQRAPQGKCFRKDKNASRATRDEGKRCKKQLWKQPGHPRRRWEVVPRALGQDSLAAHRGAQPEQVNMIAYLFIYP